MTLEAEHVQDPSIAPIDHVPASQTPPVWRGHPVQMQLPPQTGPVKVTTACRSLGVIVSHATLGLNGHLELLKGRHVAMT